VNLFQSLQVVEGGAEAEGAEDQKPKDEL